MNQPIKCPRSAARLRGHLTHPCQRKRRSTCTDTQPTPIENPKSQCASGFGIDQSSRSATHSVADQPDEPFSHPDYTVGVGLAPNSCLAAHGLLRLAPESPSIGNWGRAPHPAPKVFDIQLRSLWQSGWGASSSASYRGIGEHGLSGE